MTEAWIDQGPNGRCCTRCGDGDLYPRRCSQCGQRWADRACGPTHALITDELGIGDLRREAAKAGRMRIYLAEQLGHPAGEVPPDEELLFRAAYWIAAGRRAAREREHVPGTPLSREELEAAFGERRQRAGEQP